MDNIQNIYDTNIKNILGILTRTSFLFLVVTISEEINMTSKISASAALRK